MTRILLVGLNYPPEHAGIAPYTAGLARGLARAGRDVDVITGFPYYPAWRTHESYRGLLAGWSRREIDPVDDTTGVSVLRLRHYVPGSSTGPGRIAHEASFAVHAALRSLRRRPRPDLVIGVSPSLLSCVAARLIARRAGCPFAVVVQDLYANAGTELGALGGRGGGALHRLESGLLCAADGVVVVHDHFRRGLVAGHGVDPDRITVIRNWTHIASTPPGPTGSVRRELGWPADRTVVLHAGNMGAKQDLVGVVRAGRLAGEQGRPVHFVLLGDGARRGEVHQAAAGVGTVSVLAPVSESRFPDVLAAADVLLVHEKPGLHTVAVPSKLTSYFAVGRPVVAATEPDSPASAEVIASGAGLVVPPGDPHALLDAVSRLGADPDGCRRMGANGRRYAGAELGAADAVRAYREWVDGLLERGRR